MRPEDLSTVFSSTNVVLFNIILLVFVFWSLIWKGIALWKAAQYNSKPWFIVLLILNTLGILEILYIFVFSSKNQGKN